MNIFLQRLFFSDHFHFGTPRILKKWKFFFKIYFWTILKSEHKMAVNGKYFERLKKWTWKIYFWTIFKSEQKLFWNNFKSEHKILVNKNCFRTILKSEQKRSVKKIYFWTDLKSEQKKDLRTKVIIERF